MNGLNLPTDEEIDRLATQAGFTVGAMVHVRNAPAYTAAPIRNFSWSSGQVVAAWMGGACRTPLTELVVVAAPPETQSSAELIAMIDKILDSWGLDLARAERATGDSDDWIPEYPPQPDEQLEHPAGPRDEEGYALTAHDEDDNQDSTEYPENPADEQRG